MDLINIIQARIGQLKEVETKALDYLRDAHGLEEEYFLEREMKWEGFRQARAGRKELERLLDAHQKAEKPEPELTVKPFANIQKRTAAQDQDFEKHLIREGLLIHNLGDFFKYFHNVFCLLTNTASAVWISGFIEKLEAMERALDGEAHLQDAQDSVSQWLHEHYTAFKEISNNCNLLEAELKINNYDPDK